MRHGGDIGEASRAFGIPAGEWLDLSTGINPRPWPGAARLGAADLQLDRLPSADRLARLVAAARAAYRVPDGLAVAALPGSDAAIRALPDLLPGSAALVRTTYSSYAEAWESAGRRLPLIEATDAAGQGGATHIILVNPNNPDGRSLPPADLLALARRRRGSALVVDEAFADAEEDVALAPHLEDEPALVLKSFGKLFGLPGLRLGFAAGAPRLVGCLAARFGDWPVSGTALTVGTAALADLAWQAETRAWLAAQAGRLDDVLRDAGLAVAGGCRLFRLVSKPGAARLHRRLAAQGVWTRVFPEMPDVMRIGLPADEAGLDRLARALARAGAAQA